MTDPIHQDTEYVVVRGRQQKKAIHYYDNDDDEDDYVDEDTDTPVVRRVIRRKPVREQRIKYVTNEEPDAEYRRVADPEAKEKTVKVRHTTNGEQVLLDEDDNVIKVIRNPRTPTPPMVEHRRIRIRPRERPVHYYESSEGQVIKRSPRKQIIVKHRDDGEFSEDEPTKIIRKIVIDPSSMPSQVVHQKNRLKKLPKKYIVRERPTELQMDSEEDPTMLQPQYVQVIQHPGIIPTEVPRKGPRTKYVMIRKKAETDPVYSVTSSVPVVKREPRIVYDNPEKMPATTKYIYASNDKNYK